MYTILDRYSCQDHCVLSPPRLCVVGGGGGGGGEGAPAGRGRPARPAAVLRQRRHHVAHHRAVRLQQAQRAAEVHRDPRAAEGAHAQHAHPLVAAVHRRHVPRAVGHRPGGRSRRGRERGGDGEEEGSGPSTRWEE